MGQLQSVDAEEQAAEAAGKAAASAVALGLIRYPGEKEAQELVEEDGRSNPIFGAETSKSREHGIRSIESVEGELVEELAVLYRLYVRAEEFDGLDRDNEDGEVDIDTRGKNLTKKLRSTKRVLGLCHQVYESGLGAILTLRRERLLALGALTMGLLEKDFEVQLTSLKVLRYMLMPRSGNLLDGQIVLDDRVLTPTRFYHDGTYNNSWLSIVHTFLRKKCDWPQVLVPLCMSVEADIETLSLECLSLLLARDVKSRQELDRFGLVDIVCGGCLAMNQRQRLASSFALASICVDPSNHEAIIAANGLASLAALIKRKDVINGDVLGAAMLGLRFLMQSSAKQCYRHVEHLGLVHLVYDLLKRPVEILGQDTAKQDRMIGTGISDGLIVLAMCSRDTRLRDEMMKLTIKFETNDLKQAGLLARNGIVTIALFYANTKTNPTLRKEVEVSASWLLLYLISDDHKLLHDHTLTDIIIMDSASNSLKHIMDFVQHKVEDGRIPSLYVDSFVPLEESRNRYYRHKTYVARALARIAELLAQLDDQVVVRYKVVTTVRCRYLPCLVSALVFRDEFNEGVSAYMRRKVLAALGWLALDPKWAIHLVSEEFGFVDLVIRCGSAALGHVEIFAEKYRRDDSIFTRMDNKELVKMAAHACATLHLVCRFLGNIAMHRFVVRNVLRHDKEKTRSILQLLLHAQNNSIHFPLPKSAFVSDEEYLPLPNESSSVDRHAETSNIALEAAVMEAELSRAIVEMSPDVRNLLVNENTNGSSFFSSLPSLLSSNSNQGKDVPPEAKATTEERFELASLPPKWTAVSDSRFGGDRTNTNQVRVVKWVKKSASVVGSCPNDHVQAKACAVIAIALERFGWYTLWKSMDEYDQTQHTRFGLGDENDYDTNEENECTDGFPFGAHETRAGRKVEEQNGFWPWRFDIIDVLVRVLRNHTTVTFAPQREAARSVQQLTYCCHDEERFKLLARFKFDVAQRLATEYVGVRQYPRRDIKYSVGTRLVGNPRHISTIEQERRNALESSAEPFGPYLLGGRDMDGSSRSFERWGACFGLGDAIVLTSWREDESVYIDAETSPSRNAMEEMTEKENGHSGGNGIGWTISFWMKRLMAPSSNGSNGVLSISRDAMRRRSSSDVKASSLDSNDVSNSEETYDENLEKNCASVVHDDRFAPSQVHHRNRMISESEDCMQTLVELRSGDQPVCLLKSDQGLELGCVELVTDGISGERYYQWHGSGYDISTLAQGWHHVVVVGRKGMTTFYVEQQKVGESVPYVSAKDIVTTIGNSSMQEFETPFNENILVADIQIFGTALGAEIVRGTRARVALNCRPWEYDQRPSAEEWARDQVGEATCVAMVKLLESGSCSLQAIVLCALVNLSLRRSNVRALIRCGSVQALIERANGSVFGNTQERDQNEEEEYFEVLTRAMKMHAAIGLGNMM